MIDHCPEIVLFAEVEDTLVSSLPVGHPWRIVSAVCVQRMPSITREKTDIEQCYEELKDALRMEKSRLSDFELEEAKHFEMKKERQRKALEEDMDAVQVYTMHLVLTALSVFAYL